MAVQLTAGSFAGLVTVGLYLHDCSLTHVGADLLAPLNATLRYLWLNGNQLARLDAALVDSFSSLHHLRLGSNPLRCDCSAASLRAFVDQHADALRGALAPSCLRPPPLRGRPLAAVDPADLRCRPPSFTALAARLDAPRRRLRCAAVGDPTPTLYWVEPSGRTTRYKRRVASGDTEEVEAVLELARGDEDSDVVDASISGLYTCVANNDVGNVTLTVVLPVQPRPPRVLRPYATPPPRQLVAITTATLRAATQAPAVQSILLGDSLLQLQRLSASGRPPPPPPYSLIDASQSLNRSSSSLSADSAEQVPVTSTRARSVHGSISYTGWLKIKYPTGEYAISPQPVV